MCFIFKALRIKKLYKQQKAINQEIISALDDSLLNKIKKKCDAYITYTIDNKQINKKQNVKTKQKEYLDLLEMINSQLIINQFGLCTKSTVSEQITSTFNEVESTPIKESKKKEK